LVFSATVANVIKHKPTLLLISQFEFVKKEKADRLRPGLHLAYTQRRKVE